MPRSTSIRLLVVCALAIAMVLVAVPAALAKGFKVDLRVVGKGSQVLTEKQVTTATTSVKSSPKAECFGKGSGGSGKNVSIKGDTAMGVLARASLTTPSINPLSISDHFDFGLALCGIGKSVANSKLSWYLKINHKSQSVGGDQAKVKAGQEVLWALAAFPYPNELVLQAPARVGRGMPFTVRAYSYDEKGKRKPASGVKIVGASGTTGSDGKATVALTGPRLLGATKSGEIPAARVAVCVEGKCPAGQ